MENVPHVWSEGAFAIKIKRNSFFYRVSSQLLTRQHHPCVHHINNNLIFLSPRCASCPATRALPWSPTAPSDSVVVPVYTEDLQQRLSSGFYYTTFLLSTCEPLSSLRNFSVCLHVERIVALGFWDPLLSSLLLARKSTLTFSPVSFLSRWRKMRPWATPLHT